MVSRYQSVPAVILIATIALALLALPKGAVSHAVAAGRALFLITLLVGALLVALDQSYVNQYSLRNETKVVAEIALRQGIAGDKHIGAVARIDIEFLHRLMPVLRAARHVPFNRKSRCEEMIGDRIPDRGGSGAGFLESIALYNVSHGAGRAIELAGWAQRDGAAAECVIVLDGNRVVIGAGASVAYRHDVERASGRSLGLVGWRAVANLPQKTPVCALALFPADFQFIPLGKCRNIVIEGQGVAEENPTPGN